MEKELKELKLGGIYDLGLKVREGFVLSDEKEKKAGIHILSVMKLVSIQQWEFDTIYRFESQTMGYAFAVDHTGRFGGDFANKFEKMVSISQSEPWVVRKFALPEKELLKNIKEAGITEPEKVLEFIKKQGEQK